MERNKTCYKEGCTNPITAFSIIDDSYACDTHVIGDYFWEID
jgi:hypothetical protein